MRRAEVDCCEKGRDTIDEHAIGPVWEVYGEELGQHVQGIKYCPWCGAKLPEVET